jgi:hypothetical protein
MTRFKDQVRMTRDLLDAADALASKRPPLDPVTGKALDRDAFLRWRADCVALAVFVNGNRS